MKTIMFLLLAVSLTASAAGPSQLKISAPKHPGATVRITTHGCEGGILRYNGQFIASPFDVRLDDHGKAVTRLLANDKELYCSHGLQQEWSTRYAVQIMDGGKEKIVKVRAGKTARVKL